MCLSFLLSSSKSKDNHRSLVGPDYDEDDDRLEEEQEDQVVEITTTDIDILTAF